MMRGRAAFAAWAVRSAGSAAAAFFQAPHQLAPKLFLYAFESGQLAHIDHILQAGQVFALQCDDAFFGSEFLFDKGFYLCVAHVFNALATHFGYTPDGFFELASELVVNGPEAFLLFFRKTELGVDIFAAILLDTLSAGAPGLLRCHQQGQEKKDGEKI